MRRETAWLAKEYLVHLEERSLGYVLVAEEEALLASARARFALPALRRHLESRLREAPPDVSAALTNATIAVAHDPTVWTLFEQGVLNRLGERGVADDGTANLPVGVLQELSPLRKPRSSPASPSKISSASSSTSSIPSKPRRRPLTEQGRQTQAQQSAAAAKPPTPNLKQPLGRKQVGSGSLAWLSTATDRAAIEYVALCDQLREAAGSYLPDLADGFTLLSVIRPRFGLTPMLMRVNELLDLVPPPGADAAEHADEVRCHVPTVYAAFSGSVRSLLQAREQVNGQSWSSTVEWELLRTLYAEAKEDRTFRWRIAPADVRRRSERPDPEELEQALAATVGDEGDAEAEMSRPRKTIKPRRGKYGAKAASVAWEAVRRAQAADESTVGTPSWIEEDDTGELVLLGAAPLPNSSAELLTPPQPPLHGAAKVGERVAPFIDEAATALRLEREAALSSATLDNRILLTVKPDEGERMPDHGLVVGDVVLVRDAPTAQPEVAQWQTHRSVAIPPAATARVGGASGASSAVLRARVVRVAPVSIGLDLEATNASALPARGDVQWVAAEPGDVRGALALLTQLPTAESSPSLLSAATSLQRRRVQLDYLTSDGAFARSAGGLTSLDGVVKRAEAGEQAPAYALVRTLFGAADADAKEASEAAELASQLDARLDESQRRAVRLALDASEPLVTVQGPPGTGKSAVVVEVVRRAVAAGQRVLLSAPSNKAVDNLALRLVALDPELAVVRLGRAERIDALALPITPSAVAERRSPALRLEAEAELDRMLADIHGNTKMRRERKQQMRSFMKRHMKKNLEKRLKNGPMVAIREAQVLLCTASGAADPRLAALPAFDLAVLDEAGAATRPAALIPMLHARRAVLVGDQCQLPPTVLSPTAAEAGLSISMMEAASVARPAALVTLEQSYRMHRLLCGWASGCFYDGALKSHPDAAARLLSSMPGVLSTSETETPLQVVSVSPQAESRGAPMERRDARGDIYNAAEAAAVVSHVRTLLRAGVAPSSVAVLSPYTAQVALLKRALLEAAESANQPLASIEVATVDSFQGRESDAVVLSLVRSNRRGAVGFLADRRRLNVAVTRARRHLALVCDAAMLGSSDEAPVELKSLLTRGEREGFWVEAASPGQRAVAQGVIVPAVGSSVQPSV